MTGADPIRQVDRFLETEIEARALALAFSVGLVDRLDGGRVAARDELHRLAAMPEAARVLSGPGEMACTRMPCGPSSAAR